MRISDFPLLLLSCIALFIIVAPCVADEPKPIELTIHAQAIETPVLKYRLLPAEAEIKAGNAVPILLRLPWEQTPWMTQVYPTLHEWESRPLSDPKWSTFSGVLPERFYDEMKRAAFRRDAVWEYPIGETASPYLILLPDVQGLRGFLSYGLTSKIRYHLSRSEFDKAREGILVGLANGRHLSQTPFYVNQLVAMAIQRKMLEQVDELAAQPKSPNLYWALSALPSSMVGMERANSFECDIFGLTFPAANDLDRSRTAAEWARMARQLVEFLEQVGEIPRQEPVKGEGSFVQQLLKNLTGAEKRQLAKLISHARADLPALLNVPEATVAAMSDDEAGIRWYAHMRIASDQRAAAVLALPPREAWPELRKLQAEAKLKQENTGIKGWDFLNPTSIYLAQWTLKRKIQALRIIEAVRHHLATHDGKLPESLDDIQDVSIPFDPMMNQPFEWKIKDNVATLKSVPLPADVVVPSGASDAITTLEYRLQVK